MTTSEEVRLADVILDAEGGMDLLEGMATDSSPPTIQHDSLSAILTEAVQAFLDTLNGNSLADAIEPREEMARQLGINA